MIRPEAVDPADVPRPACVRGCTMFGKHQTDCEDRDTCRGCFPRPADFGSFCESCHLRFAAMIQQAPAQRNLLLASTTPGRGPDLTAQTVARIPDGWRTDDSQPDARMHARSTAPAYEEGEPMRLACLDVAQEIADMLSTWVDRLVEEHDMRGPDLHRSNEERKDGRWRRWSPMHGVDGAYVWVEAPARFKVESASRWLIAQLANLERLDGIGDDMEVMLDVMSRAHALAPWREESKRLPGIPCPECKRVSLRIFDGETDVTCTNPACRMMIPHTRYLIWARIWEEQRTEEAGA